MTQTTLTREQVLAMEPGTDLNILVAVHVLHQPVHPLIGSPMIRLGKNYYFIPEYSGQIEDAWDVEEALKDVRVRTRYTNRLLRIILAEKGECDQYDLMHATPEQRCKAALLAVLDL
ncbi:MULTISPECIES: BC1872 family protein [unclassified Paenibacillus]|uniref:BC1872 family protein n=1 Tax=unclassified Paenibacillus TaxID=185978 RepID=UPI0009A5E3E4|nr:MULTISPECIES: hypothetical protein [unclassified Paenibacillus]SLJ98298.1 hypothetical protein SAMN06272722_102726 [Paenibacillus sp. RU5A]SOC66789.1 hypothetical protein SAMN05880581_102271 [Paenibacillus sp. RU26A]SOC70062.1 hypothetical protein SAMN05880586_102726 [Paenibacillus sp. RU5M]